MSLLKKGFAQFNGTNNSISQLYGQSFLNTFSGEPVDEYSALGISTVLGCVSLLADTLAAMELRTHQIVDGKKIEVALPDVLKRPDPESNTYELIHQFVSMLALHGNCYTFLSRDKFDNVIGMTNLHPYQMLVMPDKNLSGREYRLRGETLPAGTILHQRWFTPPQSLTGVSPINQSRNLLGLALAMERHLAQFYGEGGTPSSVLQTDQKLTADQANMIRDTWQTTHRRHRKPAVLSDGLKWTPIQTSAADQQMIETKEQLVRDIARIFRIPAHLIGAQGSSDTYQNVEQASLNFLVHSIQPYMARIERALSDVLPDDIVVEFDTRSLLRVDAKTRAEVDKINIGIGKNNPNELRVRDGEDSYDGGNVYNQSLMGKPTAGGELPSLGTGDTLSDIPDEASN
ncbi:MAG: phage portal protein [Verrucomicrobiota bacterium]